MVTTTMGRPNPLSAAQVLTTAGAFTALFSLAVGLLVLFVFPGACSFLGGLEIIMLAMLFLAGAIAFAVGKILHRRSRLTV